MEMVVEVIGMKAFKGNVQGKDYDSGALYSIVKMDERFNRKDQSGTNWKFGHAFEEWRIPTAELIMRMAHLKPSMQNPVPVRLTIERVSNGSETTEIVIDCEPAAKAAADPLTGEIKPTAQQPTPPLRKAA